MGKNYTKLFYEILNTPIIVTMPDDLWRFFIELMLVVDDKGVLPSNGDIGFQLRRTEEEVGELLNRLVTSRGCNGFIGKWGDGTRVFDYYYIQNQRYKSESRSLSVGKRLEIFAYYNYRCVYCGAKAEQVDHVMPVSQGGSDDITNLVAACTKCNMKKGGRTPEQADMGYYDG